MPIEQIEPGDTVLTHLPDGSAYTFVVDVKPFNIDKAAGTAAIGLQAARETDNHGSGVVAAVEAPVGMLTHRIIPDHPNHRSNHHRMTAAPDPNYRHQSCYAQPPRRVLHENLWRTRIFRTR